MPARPAFVRPGEAVPITSEPPWAGTGQEWYYFNDEEAIQMVAEMDWEHRVLCSDGNCIGVIGRDGRCKECGRPYEGKLPWDNADENEEHRKALSGADDNDPEYLGASEYDDDDFDDSGDATETEDDDDSASLSDHEWEDRLLCSDGNCIGVIGPDGHCKECGKPYDPSGDDQEED